jgi:hypothetical protein
VALLQTTSVTNGMSESPNSKRLRESTEESELGDREKCAEVVLVHVLLINAEALS